MRDFDHNGLLLAEYQAKLFEKSAELGCSTGVFMRRFMHSDLLKQLDRNDSSMLSMDPVEGLDHITRQFGETEYGKLTYSKNSLFWIGYMYRYISYTRNQPASFVMKLFDYRKLNNVYYAYHTQDPEWCVRSLLEANNLSENIFDNNYRLKEAMKASIAFASQPGSITPR